MYLGLTNINTTKRLRNPLLIVLKRSSPSVSVKYSIASHFKPILPTERLSCLPHDMRYRFGVYCMQGNDVISLELQGGFVSPKPRPDEHSFIADVVG